MKSLDRPVSGKTSEGWIAFLRRRRIIARRFRETLGYRGNFRHPRDYYEKVQYRKLWGNHAFYATIADKFRVRDYVADRVGQQYLIPLLGVYDRLSPAILDALPERFVINASHGCGWYRVVRDKRDLDVRATCEYFNRIVGKVYGRWTGEYHYSLIEPKILILELLDDDGDLPWDYDIFCYNSPEGFDYAVTLEPHGDRDPVNFDRDWKLLDGELHEREKDRYVDPDNFSEMLEVARKLSADFDFARIDLYNAAGRIYFGEITLTPSAGFGRICNPVREAMRSDMWKLDTGNTRLYRKPWPGF